MWYIIGFENCSLKKASGCPPNEWKHVLPSKATEEFHRRKQPREPLPILQIHLVVKIFRYQGWVSTIDIFIIFRSFFNSVVDMVLFSKLNFVMNWFDFKTLLALIFNIQIKLADTTFIRSDFIKTSRCLFSLRNILAFLALARFARYSSIIVSSLDLYDQCELLYQ